MSAGYDERCAADLALVVDGRGLAAGEADRLIRAVTGAVRPNRDKPFWDLAHALTALLALHGHVKADRGRAVIDLALDPRLARPDALRVRLAETCAARGGAASLSADGVEMMFGEQAWRMTFAGLARALGLAEFLMTCDDLKHFADIGALLSDAAAAPDAGALTRDFVRLINAYRQAHMPMAAVERRFRAVLKYLEAEGARHAVTDAAILEYWRSEIQDGERPQFRTVAEHFVTYVKLSSVLRGLQGVRGAGSLDAIEGWQDRLDSMLADVAAEEEATALVAEKLTRIPETPKILTGAEREDLIAALGLDPFHRSHPRTVLRAVSFGAVQSGIANRLRRGGGGGGIAERVTCEDAESYADVLARIDAVQAHLQRMLKIAVALRLGGRHVADEKIAALVSAAEADIKRVRRAGFDGPREILIEAFAAVDETLAETAREAQAFAAAGSRFGGANALAAMHAEDMAAFAEGLTAAYGQGGGDEPRQSA